MHYIYPDVASSEIIQYVQLSSTSDEFLHYLEDANNINGSENAYSELHFPKWGNTNGPKGGLSNDDLSQLKRENWQVNKLKQIFLEADERNIRMLLKRNGGDYNQTQAYMEAN